ncbi:MAG: metallophosphoesterase family protein [Methylococcaceae bacterium]
MKQFISTLFKRKKEKICRISDNTRVYCIGDIHGRDDLLQNIHDKIALDSVNYSGNKLIVYLGDYIDRGLHSKKVIDLLLKNPLSGFNPIYLRGNHEQVLLDFLNFDPSIATQWLTFGGQATLLSYGVSVSGIPFGEKLVQLQRDLADKIPNEHLTFYSQLEYCYSSGDYFFVHAGVKPKIKLTRQNSLDMMWIRDEFLSSKHQHEMMIVHGHSVTDDPVILPNRIGIDTGAYMSGRLTCLVLEGEEKRFIQTGI